MVKVNSGSQSAASLGNERKWLNPTGGKIRVDSSGDGHFGAPRTRNGKPYPHNGSDYRAKVDDPVRVVTNGIINRLGWCYPGAGYRYIAIRTAEGHEARELYVRPGNNIIPGTVVQVGEIIGFVQDLTLRYRNIDNHVHLDILFQGQWINPETLIEEAA